jgi:hypothetical protein
MSRVVSLRCIYGGHGATEDRDLCIVRRFLYMCYDKDVFILIHIFVLLSIHFQSVQIAEQ